MAMCPKCRKQNPSDAAFCGFCGASLAQSQPAGGPAKTVFGYNLDPSALAAASAASAQDALSHNRVAQPKAVLLHQDPSQVPTLNDGAATSLGGGVIANKYTLGKLLRQLPTGELFKAKDATQNLDLELFIVKTDVFPSPLDMERTRRELRQLQKVDSSAIVKVFDHGKLDDGRLFVAMEAVSGVFLDEVVSAGPLELDEAQRIITAVGTGLAEAQKMGVIHRDIAPHNILVSKQDVKIRGFGIAAPIKQHIFGTPEFMSPEQASGRPVDQRSNIYSLGALMFYMLTQKPPFEGDSADDLLSKHQQAEPVSPQHAYPQFAITDRADGLILKALAKSSSRRHLTLRQFLREVESLSKKESAPSTEVPPVSFVTPVHGVTALTGGDRPPSAEMLKVEKEQGLVALTVEPPPAAEPLPPVSPTPGSPKTSGSEFVQPAKAIPPDPLATGPLDEVELVDTRKTVMDSSSSTLAPDLDSPLPAPVKKTIAESSADRGVQPPLAAESPRPAAITPTPKGKLATGELSSSVSLTSTPKSVAGQPEAKQKPITKPPAQRPPAAGDGKKGGGFRETMWFFKGEVESAMAETGEEDAPPQPEELPDDLAVKYVDDGSMTEEQARRLSLRTGKTQMMAQVKIPSGNVPGQQMKAEEFIHEMNRGSRIAIWSGIFVVVAGLAGLIVWLAMS